MGKFGVQWAKVAGIGTIIAVASFSHEKDLKAMGATHVIDRHSATIVEDIQTIAGDKDAVTHIYDCVNWTVSLPAVQLLWSALIQHSSFLWQLLIPIPPKYELATELVSNTLPSRILTLHKAEGAIPLLEKLGKDKNVKADIVIGARFKLEPIADLFWPHVGQWLCDEKILIPKFRLVEGLDETKVNEALDSYRDGKPVTQAIVHPWGKAEA